jgi:lipoprotein NlpI
MKDISQKRLPRKPEFLCQVLQYKGLAYMKMKNYEAAADAFQEELNVASEA